MNESFFKKVDDFALAYATKLKSSTLYQKALEEIRTLNEKQQKIIHYTSSSMLFILPIVLILTLFYFRSRTLNEIKLKDEIENHIFNIKKSTIKFNSKSKSMVSPKRIDSKNNFKSLLKKIIKKEKIKRSFVKINQFSIAPLSSLIRQIEVNIKFKDLTYIKFSNLLLELQKNLNNNINHINIQKDPLTHFLNGSFQLLFLTKVH